MRTYNITFYQDVKTTYRASAKIKTNLSEEEVEERLNSVDLMNDSCLDDQLEEIFGDDAKIEYVDIPEECVDCAEYDETVYDYSVEDKDEE